MRVLLLQGQSVYDPSSGAAQSMRQMAEALASAGCELRSLSTSGCENGAPAAHLRPVFERLGRDAAAALDRPAGQWLEVDDLGVHHHLLLTDPARRHRWALDHGHAFDQQFERLLQGFAPHVVLTFGLDDGDLLRRAQARRSGARVVMCLHNLVSAQAQPPGEVDAFWVPSPFMHARHARAWGGHAPLTTMPTPLGRDGRAGAAHQDGAARVFVTFINPEPAKGVGVVAGLVQRWLVNRPGQPVLIVEGRARADQWFAALQACGVPPSACGQVFVSPNLADLSAVWASSKVVLMPSIVEEAAGRVALEAMRHGVVPVVSDRGALPETVGSADWVVALPEALHWQDPAPVGEAVCQAWDQAVSRWLDDDAAWQAASARAVQVAQAHLDMRVGPLYRRWLEELVDSAAV